MLSQCLHHLRAHQALPPSWLLTHAPHYSLAQVAAWRTFAAATSTSDQGQTGSSGESTSEGSEASTSEASQAAPTAEELAAQQQAAAAVQDRELKAALKQALQATRPVANLASLAALSGHYRDTLVSMEALYWQQVEEMPSALASAAPAPPRPAQPRASYHSCTLFPLVDVTTLPDSISSLPPGQEVQLDVRYMDRITCWKQLQPNHIETSTQLVSGISLFPPQEATYPTYVDFQAALRLLRLHKSRKRMSMTSRRRTRQDKYQLKTWDHHPSE